MVFHLLEKYNLPEYNEREISAVYTTFYYSFLDDLVLNVDLKVWIQFSTMFTGENFSYILNEKKTRY